MEEAFPNTTLCQQAPHRIIVQNSLQVTTLAYHNAPEALCGCRWPRPHVCTVHDVHCRQRACPQHMGRIENGYVPPEWSLGKHHVQAG